MRNFGRSAMHAAIVLVTPCGALRWGTVCCHRGLLFMAIVEDAFPSRSDGRKQPLRPYRGSYPASEANHEYRHLISHRVRAECGSLPLRTSDMLAVRIGQLTAE